MQRRLLSPQRRQQIVLIQFADHFAFMRVIANIHRQLLNNAAGFTLDFHLRDGLHFSRRHHRARNIHPLDGRQFFLIDLGRFGADRLQ